jgi:protoporphyrinogen oxidase
VWKTEAHNISPKFASEKIQGFSFINLIRRLLRIGGQVTEPYFQTWLYHKYGSGELYKRLGKDICAMGGEFLLSTGVETIEHNRRKVHALTLSTNDGPVHIPCGWLVNTIPLPHFINFFGDDVPFLVRHHASKLRYISLILIYVEFTVDRISEDHWFYLLDPMFSFNRVTEQKNLSDATMEPGKTVLSFELTCRIGDKYWQMTDEELFALVKADCRNIHFIRNRMDRITDFHVKRVPHVYEIYFKRFDQHAELVLDYLREFDNVCTIGRRGLFLQGDQHQAVEMGLRMGELLGRGKANAEDLDAYMRTYVKYIDHY